MNPLTSKIEQLERSPHLLLEGRIAFRRRWILAWTPKKPAIHQKSIAWELAYDEEHNFARMGVEFVDDDWGKLKPIKPRARKRSDFLKRSFVLATADAIQKEAAE